MARIVFAEIPDFYAEVERAADPALRDRPVIVGGNPRKGGLVQAASADARACGVSEKMLVLEALERCPRARALRTNMRRYRESASRLRAALRRVVPSLEAAGLGAAYLDASGTSSPSSEIAAALRESVRDELGMELRVGIAPVKFVARLAAEEAGDGRIRIVEPPELRKFLDPLATSRLPGVGPHTESRLRELGAAHVGDLRQLDEAVIESALGAHGLAIRAAARGEADNRVQAARHPRSLSQESTLASDELDVLVLAERLQTIAGHLERALALEGLATRRVALKVRYADQETSTRSRTLARPVSNAAELQAVGQELLGRTQAGTRAVRLLGLSVSRLLPARRDERQLELFPSGS